MTTHDHTGECDHSHSHVDSQPHGHGHSHSHGHHHHELPTNLGWVFGVGVGLNTTFVAIEMVGGWWWNSLSLLADAGHNLSDVLGLLLAWGAHWLSNARPSERRTYGWKSSSILAALFNAQLLLLAVGGIIWEALGRLREPAVSQGWGIIAVALAGAVINTATALLFMRGSHGDLNVRGAFLHMTADAAVSVGVAIAGALILWTGYQWIDPLTSLLIALVILWGTWSLLVESLDLALHAVPRHIELEEVRHALSGLPDVQEVHDLHVWAMSTTESALTVHLVAPNVTDNEKLLQQASLLLDERFAIRHVTLQIEGQSCAQCQLPAP